MEREAIRHLARLARLSDEDAESLAEDFARIVDYVDQLHAVDVAGVPPFSGAPEPVARPDRPVPGLDPEAALEAAPDLSGDRFRVPRREGP